MSNVFFDIETTGLGEISRRALEREVGIFNLAYSRTGGKISSLYGMPENIPFEKTSFIDKLRRINRKGILAAEKAKTKEEDILRQFVGSVKEGDTLIGWNSFTFDSPVLIQRLKDLKMDKEVQYSRLGWICRRAKTSR